MGIGLYGGTINSGTVNGKELTAGSCYEAIGEFQAGSINEEDLYGRLSSLMLRTPPLSPLCTHFRYRVECGCIPGAGACGGMFTANTMSSAIEALGMSLPGTASKPAIDRATGELAHSKVG